MVETYILREGGRAMTLEQRNAAILKAMAERSARTLASPETARAALIKDGIYTKDGQLRVKFGGARKSAKSAA